MKLTVACVQFNAVLGNTEINIAKVRHLVSKIKKEIDLLVLPELAITGYNFKSRQEIEPHLSELGKGPSASLASELSRKFHCHTVIGYPEKLHDKIYNSALVTDNIGEVVHNYRKTHLYETDETWGCSENPEKSFAPFYLNLGPERKPVLTNMGICMDLNPYKFEAPFFELEFASSCYFNESSLIILPTNWLSPESPSIQEGLSEEKKIEKSKELQKRFEQNPEAPLEDSGSPSELTVNYWILRLFPFLSHPRNPYPRRRHKTAVVMCNRSGIEDQVLYGGSSTIYQFDESANGSEAFDMTNPSVDVLGSLGHATEDVLIHEIEV